VLAGFCFTLIVFVLGWNVANTSICGYVTYGQISVLLVGVASVLLIASMEFFLAAKGFDTWSLSDRWHDYLVETLGKTEWDKKQTTDQKQCRNYERLGRHLYNLAMFLIFAGFFS